MADDVIRVSFSKQIVLKTPEGQSNAEILTMYVNPNKLDFSQGKILNTSNTIAGFVTEYWGNDLMSIRAAAVTGSFRQLIQFKKDSQALTRYVLVPDESTGVLDLSKRRTSQAYTRFIELLNFYRIHPEVQMIYDGFLYNGYFSSFSYTEDVNMPLMFTLSFEFISQKEVTPQPLQVDILSTTQESRVA